MTSIVNRYVSPKLWNHCLSEKWSLHFSLKTDPAMCENIWCHMILEKVSRQKYHEYHESHETWPSWDLCKLFIAAMQYATVVRKLPRLQKRFSFQEGCDSYESVFHRNASSDITLSTSCALRVFFHGVHNRWRRDSPSTAKNIFLQYHMISSFSKKGGLYSLYKNWRLNFLKRDLVIWYRISFHFRDLVEYDFWEVRVNYS